MIIMPGCPEYENEQKRIRDIILKCRAVNPEDVNLYFENLPSLRIPEEEIYMGESGKCVLAKLLTN